MQLQLLPGVVPLADIAVRLTQLFQAPLHFRPEGGEAPVGKLRLMRESGGPILFREEDKIGIDSASRAPHQLALHQPLRHRFDISGGYADDFGDVRFRQRLLIRR